MSGFVLRKVVETTSRLRALEISSRTFSQLSTQVSSTPPPIVFPNYKIESPLVVPVENNYILPNNVQYSNLNPLLPKCNVIMLPTINKTVEKLDPSIKSEIKAPAFQIIEKFTARMIQIRKKKMKKHKLKKLRKRMRFKLVKDRQRRAWRREVEFQGMLMAKIASAEKFDAEDWAKGILNKINNKPVPETREEKMKRLTELMRKNKGKIWL